MLWLRTVLGRKIWLERAKADMDDIKIIGSDENCEISGEGFNYKFVNGHPTEIIIDGKKQEPVPVPEIDGKPAKAKTKLVHKYWDSAMIITEYRKGLKKLEVKYYVLATGEMKKETLF